MHAALTRWRAEKAPEPDFIQTETGPAALSSALWYLTPVHDHDSKNSSHRRHQNRRLCHRRHLRIVAAEMQAAAFVPGLG